MKKNWGKKEEFAEDFCFICKDGGLLLVCEYKRCLKAYHPECVGKDSAILDTNAQWVCNWHSCLVCRKSSELQCFCCPNAVCQECSRTAEFVQVRKKKGFCNDCLKLALLIEENLDVDSDGSHVDFKDTETYEFLFKDYWEIVKQNEILSLEDLHKADAVLKKGKKSEDMFNLDKPVRDEEELISNVDNMDFKGGGELPLVEEPNTWMKIEKRAYKHRKKNFIGWGSEQLIGFLSSIGKNTDEPITQLEVYNIIRDYIMENKLIHPQRKKKVLCDVRLKALFGRKAVNRLKISALLEAHFAESQVSEDDSLFGSEDENVASDCKRQRRLSDPKTHVPASNDVTGKASEAPKSGCASIIAKNVKLVYLRRTLIEDFLKNPETFESKVMGCFVRVKSDPYDFSVPKNFFRLEQVTGIGKALEAYKTGDTNTDIVLHVSNMMRDINIFMLSDDDFSEEECEDLRQRVKQGLLKRFTIEELDKKARSLHEDITNHWIDREIVILQKRIDRANEKGWRRELLEYIERRQLLQTPAERLRLLKELPKIIADAEIELEASPDHPEDALACEGNRKLANQVPADGESKRFTDQVHANRENEGNGALSLQTARSKGTKGYWVAYDEKTVERKAEDTGVAFLHSSPHDRGGQGADCNLMDRTRDIKGNAAAPIQKARTTGTEESTSSIYSFFFGNRTAPNDEVAKSGPSGNETTHNDEVAKSGLEAGNGIAAEDKVSNKADEEQSHNEESKKEKESQEEVIDIDEDAGDLSERTKEVKQVIPVIDLDDDNDPTCREEQGRNMEINPETRKIWHYTDPKGGIQGPFSIYELKFWRDLGWFDENFKVWVTGKSPEDSISLKDAIRLTTI